MRLARLLIFSLSLSAEAAQIHSPQTPPPLSVIDMSKTIGQGKTPGGLFAEIESQTGVVVAAHCYLLYAGPNAGLYFNTDTQTTSPNPCVVNGWAMISGGKLHIEIYQQTDPNDARIKPLAVNKALHDKIVATAKAY